jgi:hypothetical protein
MSSLQLLPAARGQRVPTNNLGTGSLRGQPELALLRRTLKKVIGRNQWSGFDVRDPTGHELAKRTSNPKPHWNQYFASGPLIPTFVKEPAEVGYEILESNH